MRKIILSVSSLFIGLSAFSQQDFQFTQYMYDRLSFNPGFAGIDGKICATAMFRQQWAGFDGRPQTFLFNVHGPVRQLHGGLGLTFFNDQLGQFKDNYARLSYSFHKGIPGGTLGIGISAGIISKQLAYNWLPPDGIATITTDNAIPDQAVGQTTYDLSLGLYYAGPNYYVGLSSTHLTESDLSTLGYLNKRHYYVVAGYNWLVPDGSGDWMVKPTLLVKSDASSTQVDITVRGMWRNMVWAGFGYRLQDALPILLGFQKTAGPGMIKIGYSYDLTLSDIKDYSSGSHEFMVNYCFNLEKPPVVQRKKTVRFL